MSNLAEELKNVPLLGGLDADQLNEMAGYCGADDIGAEHAGKPLDYSRKIVFISKGRFERVFLAGGTDTATVLDELASGDFWGEHFLFSEASENLSKIGLRSVSTGRIVRIPASRFEHCLKQWPELRTKLLESLAQATSSQLIRLGEALTAARQPDVVLDRIESLAELLIESLSGKSEETEVIQRKFLLSESPKSHPASVKKRIEQIYLPSFADREDRIRREGANTYYRTTKFNAGLQRKVFKRPISKTEYDRLAVKREGEIITKEREYLKVKRLGGKIVVDRFEGALAGIVIVEADFESTEDANKFSLPEFLDEKLVKDITEDSRYANQSLAVNGKPE